MSVNAKDLFKKVRKKEIKNQEDEGVRIGFPKGDVRLSNDVSHSQSYHRKIPMDVLKEYPKSTQHVQSEHEIKEEEM